MTCDQVKSECALGTLQSGYETLGLTQEDGSSSGVQIALEPSVTLVGCWEWMRSVGLRRILWLEV